MSAELKVHSGIIRFYLKPAGSKKKKKKRVLWCSFWCLYQDGFRVDKRFLNGFFGFENGFWNRFLRRKKPLKTSLKGLFGALSGWSGKMSSLERLSSGRKVLKSSKILHFLSAFHSEKFPKRKRASGKNNTEMFVGLKVHSVMNWFYLEPYTAEKKGSLVLLLVEVEIFLLHDTAFDWMKGSRVGSSLHWGLSTF